MRCAICRARSSDVRRVKPLRGGPKARQCNSPGSATKERSPGSRGINGISPAGARLKRWPRGECRPFRAHIRLWVFPQASLVPRAAWAITFWAFSPFAASHEFSIWIYGSAFRAYLPPSVPTSAIGKCSASDFQFNDRMTLFTQYRFGLLLLFPKPTREPFCKVFKHRIPLRTTAARLAARRRLPAAGTRAAAGTASTTTAATTTPPAADSGGGVVDDSGFFVG